MDNHPLLVFLSCQDNPTCTFTNTDITVELTIVNNTNQEIGVPLEYLRMKGMNCFLVDNENGKKITLGVSLTPDSIKIKFTRLSPKASVKISRAIESELILSIRKKMVDMTVHIGIGGLMEMRPGDAPIKFVENAEVLIRGKDKIDFENNR